MRRFRFLPQVALLAAFALMNGGCVLLPEIKDRIVELAVGGSTSHTFAGVLTSNTSLDQDFPDIDLGTDLHLGQILDDAKIDTSQVTHIVLSKVSYRITRFDGDARQRITGGTITIQRLTGPHAGTAKNLVVGFTASPGAEAGLGFKDVTLDADGVAVVNQLLNDILAALPEPVPNGEVAVHLGGTSSAAAEFDLELKITVSITGTVKVSVPT